jgi:hypothetical protein
MPGWSLLDGISFSACEDRPHSGADHQKNAASTRMITMMPPMVSLDTVP